MQGPAFRVVARVGSRDVAAVVADRPVTVGASDECDVVLSDPTVSRRHARFSVVASDLVVEDLGSRNGVRVEGRRVERESIVLPGTRLTLGDVEVRVESLRQEDAALAPGTASPGPAPTPSESRNEATLASAGLTRFCLRELPPLLEQVAGGIAPDAFGRSLVQALQRSEPTFGVELRRGDAVIAATNPDASAHAVTLARGSWALRISLAHADAEPAARNLGELLLALLSAVRPPSGPPVSVERPKPTEAFETQHAGLREIYWQAARVAASRLNVLITGESGTGKELLARYLHRRGDAAAPYLVLNCAALPPDLLDAELFGIDAGVATGVSARPGRFELAHRGTLFLDEIGDMSLETQARILRVLQEGEVYRVGSHRPRPADVRVVSATNRDIDAMVRDGRFRLDLLHRIADWRVQLPPLRERRGDIANLAAGFLSDACAERGVRSGGLSQGALVALQRYAWPGNVRELEREMRRAALFAGDGEMLVSTQLRPEIASATDTGGEVTLAAQLEREERRILSATLSALGGSVAEAAEALGVSKSTLYRRLSQLGLTES